MDVVRPAEAVAPPQRLDDSSSLEHGGGDAESDERQPCDRGQHVEEDERRKRHEHDQAGDEGGHEPAPFDRPVGHQHSRADVRQRDERSADENADHLLGPAVQSRHTGPEDPDRQAEPKRRPEPAPVQLEPLGHHLTDGPGLGRQRRREGLVHALSGHGATVSG